MSLIGQSKKAARFLLHKGGALHAVRSWYGSRIRILMYHKFPEGKEARELLSQQCNHIKRHYNVVSMTEIGRALREGRPLSRNTLAVTVDDGFRDFLLNGHPVFHKYGIPTLVYLVSGFLDGQLWFWWDQVEYAVRQSRRPSFECSLDASQPARRFRLETEQHRRLAIDAIVASIKKLEDHEDRKRACQALCEELGVRTPQCPPSDAAPLSWSEARELSKNGVEFGAHTVTHPMLSAIRDARAVKDEILVSKRRIEQELDREVFHFCYPFGRRSDFNEDSVRTVGECGFLTSTTAILGLNDLQSHPLKLQRIGVDSTMPLPYYQEMLAGVHFA